MKIAVTGAGGFLGNALVHDLRKQGFSVLCLSRQTRPYSLAKSDIDWEQIDYVEPSQICQVLQGCHALVHLAGIAHSKASTEDTLRYDIGICQTTESLLNAAKAASVRIFIYASSVKVYGEKSLESAFSEDSPPQPNSLYGTCKLKAETKIAETSNFINSIIFRFPPMYGPGMKGSVKHLFRAAQLGLPLPFHNFRHRRHFLYVKNASALIIGAVRGDLKAGLYNVYDPIAWQLGPFYREVYRAVRGKELPWYLSWKMPIFFERLLRRVSMLEPLMQPFELQSRSIQEWAPLLPYTAKEGIAEVAHSMSVQTQNQQLFSGKKATTSGTDSIQ